MSTRYKENRVRFERTVPRVSFFAPRDPVSPLFVSRPLGRPSLPCRCKRNSSPRMTLTISPVNGSRPVAWVAITSIVLSLRNYARVRSQFQSAIAFLSRTEPTRIRFTVGCEKSSERFNENVILKHTVERNNGPTSGDFSFF